MKRNPAVALFMMSLSSLIFVGCATFITYDQLPHNVPKGYVEFSNSDSKYGLHGVDVRWKHEDSERIIDHVVFGGGGRVKRHRIAERPGMYTFIVNYGTATKKVKVEVIEGMITPVRFIIDFTRSDVNGNIITHYFNLSLNVEKPISHEEKERLRQEKERLQTQSAQIDSTGGSKESDIARGLTMLSNKQYTNAILSLESGLEWLKSDPSYRATSDSLVSKEAEYVSKLIEQIQGANQKRVFGSSNPMAIVIERAIEAQAKVIKVIDDQRRSQVGSVSGVLNNKETEMPFSETVSTLDVSQRYKWVRGKITPGFILDSPGDRDITLNPGKEKPIEYGGLSFTQQVTASILKDGTLVVTEEGITGTDHNGAKWVSRNVNIGGEKIIAFFTTTGVGKLSKGVTLAMGARPSVSTANEIRKGGRFIADNNGTVLDTRTNLMWAAKDNGSNINWQNAKSYCENYRGGGYTDWRMPTQDELVGLYDANKSRSGACNHSHSIHVATELIDITCFIPWASETRGSDSAYFNFGNGERYWGPQSYTGNKRALPVRFTK